jgi:methylthioribose-1-phosphate isomerase
MKINGTHYRTIWVDPDNRRRIKVIDQRLLPHQFIINELVTVEETAGAIIDMVVRGAGLIGATAAYGMYLAALAAHPKRLTEDMARAAALLTATRPTARNLAWAVERVQAAVAGMTDPAVIQQRTFATATAVADEDAGFCRRIGEHGAQLIKNIAARKSGGRVNILTHCNAGWLAFVDYGSATAPIYAARDEGIDIHVWVDETRPWNQGARLTCWELAHENIAHTLITDNAGGHLMQQGLVDMVIVGSDRTTHTGDVANKIGTYLKALAAKDNMVPFYVALPSSTIDWEIDRGKDIPIEERSGTEITQITGPDDAGILHTVHLCAPGTAALNYGFDITPARLVTGLITERGVVAPEKQAIARLFGR